MPVFRKIFARDPANPNDIASNATITLFDPADPNKTPVALTKLDGTALQNPYTVNRQGEGPAFQHESLYIVGWEGGGHSGEFDSIESMHADTLAARTAAENSVLLAQDAQAAATNAGATAATEAVAEVESRIAAGDFKGPKGDTGLPGPDAIPTDEAVAAYATTPGTATAAALSSTIASASMGRVPEQLAQAISLRAFSPVDIVCVGSSTTEGVGAADSADKYVTQFARNMAASFNPEGVPGGISYAATGAGWTRTGTVTDSTYGLATKSLTLASGAKLYRSLQMTGVTILFEQGGGQAPFTVKIDSETYTVTPAASGVTTGIWESPSVELGWHEVTIAGPATIGQVYAHGNDRDYGVRVWGAGKGSTRMYNWHTEFRTTHEDALKALRPAGITLQTGSNELSDGNSATTFKTIIVKWIDQVVAALGYTPWIGLLAQHPRPNYTTDQSALWESYKTVMREIADERAYVTYHDLGGGFSTDGTDPLDLVGSDNMHLTSRGYSLLADNLSASLGIPVRVGTAKPPAITEIAWNDLYSTLALWDADSITLSDGNQITSWSPDHGAETVAAVPTSAAGPIIRANRVNGHKAAEFSDAADNSLTTPAWSMLHPVPITMISVHRVATTAPTINHQIAGGVTPNYVFVSALNDGNYTFGAGGTNQLVTPGPARGQWVVMIAVFDGANSRVYLNKTTPVAGTTGTTSAAGLDEFRIGNNSGLTARFAGEQTYMRVCGRALTTPEAEAEMQALAAKYGVTLA